MVTATNNPAPTPPSAISAVEVDPPGRAVNSPLPPLPTAAAALFAAWLEERGDLARIAARLSRPPHEVLADLRAAPLADYIAAAELVADRAARRRGLDRLAHVMENSPDLAEQRRAATALQQALNRDQRARPVPRAAGSAAARASAVPHAPSPAAARASAVPRAAGSAAARASAVPRAAGSAAARASACSPDRPAPDEPADDLLDDQDRIDDLRERLTERLAEHLDEDEAEDIAEDLAEDIILDDQTGYARHILGAIQSDPTAYPSCAVTAARALLEPPNDPRPRPP